MEFGEFPAQGVVLGGRDERGDLALQGGRPRLDVEGTEGGEGEHDEDDDESSDEVAPAKDEKAGQADDTAGDPPPEIGGEEEPDDPSRFVAVVRPEDDRGQDEGEDGDPAALEFLPGLPSWD